MTEDFSGPNGKFGKLASLAKWLVVFSQVIANSLLTEID